MNPAINVIEKNPFAPRPFVFSEAAICLRDAIRASGYSSEHLVNRIDPDAFSIVLGGTPAFQKELAHMDPARCAIFNFEQLGSGSSMATPEYRRWLADWLVLDYHGANVAQLQRENHGQLAFEIPLVPSDALATTGTQDKDLDVLFYGTMSPRRLKVLQAIADLGLKVGAVAGSYGIELAPAIRRAKTVLHVHFYETGLFPAVRILQPVVMGVPIVCETSVFSRLNDWSRSGIVFDDYEHLAATCARRVASKDGAESTRAFARAIDFATPFAQVVRAFLQRGSAASRPI